MNAAPQIHPFPPVWNSHSRILILGSFPSVRSRETGFYYGHPQNRFWPLMANLFEEEVPLSPETRKAFALRHGIALWDVIQSCSITGSSDASIRSAVPNPIHELLQQTDIRRIICNGGTAHRLYERYCTPACGLHAEKLPSTSAANAAWNMKKLAQSWRVILSE